MALTPTSSKLLRSCAATVCALALGLGIPAAASQDAADSESVEEAKEERSESRRAQLEARINLELVAAEDLEVVEALQAATELVNLQQAKIDSARQRLQAAEDARLLADQELESAGAAIELLRAQALDYAVESYVGLNRDRTEAWLSATDATVAVHKVALLDSLGADTFDVLDQLRATEERRRELVGQTEQSQADADEIALELATAIGALEARQQAQLELKAEVDQRRRKWEAAFKTAEAEEAELSAFIKSEQERIERELEEARRAALAAAIPSNPTNPNVGIISDGGWTWPSAGRAGSGYGQRLHPILGYYRLHAGLDISAPTGDPIWAAHDGIVQLAGWNGGYGNAVVLGHGDSTSSLYAHMSSLAVSTGQYVTAGQVVGYIGSTGLSTGPHLHFEVRINGSPVDPRPYLP